MMMNLQIEWIKENNVRKKFPKKTLNKLPKTQLELLPKRLLKDKNNFLTP